MNGITLEAWETHDERWFKYHCVIDGNNAQYSIKGFYNTTLYKKNFFQHVWILLVRFFQLEKRDLSLVEKRSLAS